MITLYRNIYERRKALGLTQTELAHKVGYSEKSSIARVEKGEVDLPLSKVHEFAKALETTASDLMGLEDYSTTPDIPPYIEGTSEIIDLYCRVTPEQRHAVLQLLRSFVGSE